jgi:hypothetical protein
MDAIPTTREAVRCVWERRAPEYSGVTDSATASRILTALVRAAMDMLAYRLLSDRPDAIHMVAGDRLGYVRYGPAAERSLDYAVVLSHILAANSEEAGILGDLIGQQPPVRSLRILVLAGEHDCSVNRLDLDPESRGGVSWYGPFDNALFTEIAVGFALFITHMVANVFDDDDGTETFDESFEWVV